MLDANDPITGEPLNADDLRLLGRAARERWPVAENFRAAVVRRMVVLAIKPDVRPVDSIGAARVLALMDRLNVHQERLDWERRRGAPNVNKPAPEISDAQFDAIAAIFKNGEPLTNGRHPHP